MPSSQFPASENAVLYDNNGFPLSDPRSGALQVVNSDGTLEEVLIVLKEIKMIMQIAFHIELK